MEVTTFVPSGPRGEVVSVAAAVPGRRVHAELCSTYQIQDERKKRERELAAYNRKQRSRSL